MIDFIFWWVGAIVCFSGGAWIVIRILDKSTVEVLNFFKAYYYMLEVAAEIAKRKREAKRKP